MILLSEICSLQGCQGGTIHQHKNIVITKADKGKAIYFRWGNLKGTYKLYTVRIPGKKLSGDIHIFLENLICLEMVKTGIVKEAK